MQIILGFHRGLQSSLNSAHPGFWKFIQWLKAEIAQKVQLAISLGAGGPARKREKKWRDRDERFQRVALSWRDTHVDEQILHVQHPLLIYLRNFAYMNLYPYVDEQ